MDVGSPETAGRVTRPNPAFLLGRLPLWWRLIAWSAITIATAQASDRHWQQIASGALMIVASAGLIMREPTTQRARAAVVLIVTCCGLAAILIAPSGYAEIPVVFVAGRIPAAFGPAGQRIVTALSTVAFAIIVAVVSGSLVGLLAGAGIPLLVQRAIERRELIAERDRAQALLAEVQAGREAETQTAALRERGRIARDMHDVLAHSLAGLSLQLQAVRALAAREDVGAVLLDPLDKAAALARDGLTEAREVVGALRDPVGLGLDALPTLVDRHPGNLRLSTHGVPIPVSAEAGHAVYRAVQEALTNAARYAPGAEVEVNLTWLPEGARVRIDDTGLPPGRSAVSGQGTGLGLAGMDDRIRQAGGTLHAGPRDEGGWRVEIAVPRQSS